MNKTFHGFFLSIFLRLFYYYSYFILVFHFSFSLLLKKSFFFSFTSRIHPPFFDDVFLIFSFFCIYLHFNINIHSFLSKQFPLFSSYYIFSFFIIIFYLFKLDHIPSFTLSFFEHYFYLIRTQMFNSQLVLQIISFSSLFPMIKSFSNYSCPFHYYLFIASFLKSNVIFLSHENVLFRMQQNYLKIVDRSDFKQIIFGKRIVFEDFYYLILLVSLLSRAWYFVYFASDCVMQINYFQIKIAINEPTLLKFSGYTRVSQGKVIAVLNIKK